MCVDPNTYVQFANRDQFSHDSDLRPDAEKHEPYMSIDPVLSAMTFFKFALQINVQIQRFPEYASDI